MAERRPVAWRDLARLTRAETASELLLPLPWVALGALSAAFEVTAGLVAATLAVFMVGVRLNHGAVHRNIGLSPGASDVLMAIISVVLGGATHALAHTHLIHHRRCLAPDDLEGRAAAHGFWQALWRSPLYPLQIHAAALRQGDRRLRCWVAGELMAVAAVQAVVWLALDVAALKVASATLLAANAMVPMVGIWAVHRGCHGTPHVARTSRWPALDWLVVQMFQHEEHHRFPQVPTRHLPELVRRLDAATGPPTARPVIEAPAGLRCRIAGRCLP